MTMPRSIVIVGGGLAGAKSAEALRDHGFDGEVTLVSAESSPPYELPPLSKDYLAGTTAFDDALVHPAAWYVHQAIDLRLGTRAVALDPATHRVHLADDSVIDYDRLILATGSTPRELPLPGTDAAGVHHLRNRRDADAIRAVFGPDRRLVVIGAGWIGLEVAAAARTAETDVTVLEASGAPLLHVLGGGIAPMFADLHREHGVDVRCGVQVAGVETSQGRATGVRLADGTVLPADAVVIGVGVRPEVSLAEDAGLAMDNGILVDTGLRTSAADVFAVGDIANHDHPVLGHRVRVEHWANALNQPAVAAAGALGHRAEYTELPFFFSDQYDLGLEFIGHVPPDWDGELILRGDLAGREFVAFWLGREHQVLASMNVNVFDVVDQVKPLILGRRSVDPDRLADPDVPYTDL